MRTCELENFKLFYFCLIVIKSLLFSMGKKLLLTLSLYNTPYLVPGTT
jgi:hypothetical protein